MAAFAATGHSSDWFDVASRTHPGLVREANQDHCVTFCDGGCAGLIVADGVSSIDGGETASRLAVQVLQQAFLSQERGIGPAKRLFRAAQRANIAVHDLALAVPELRGMATTLTALVLANEQMFAVHIGDCRLYLYRDDLLVQLSKDHTVAAERVRFGLLSKTRALSHPGRSTLTRSLGRELIARVDQFSRHIAKGDVFVVCSDGVHGLLGDEGIARHCATTSATGLCSALIESAHERGSPDNVSAAVARITNTPPHGPMYHGLLGLLPRRRAR